MRSKSKFKVGEVWESNQPNNEHIILILKVRNDTIDAKQIYPIPIGNSDGLFSFNVHYHNEYVSYFFKRSK